jgi:hypothetical protein
MKKLMQILILVQLFIQIARSKNIKQDEYESDNYNGEYLEKYLKTGDQITKYPVVLIPGDGGNQLYTKLNKTTGPHYFCQLKSNDYFLLWLNLEEITPYVIDCLVDNIKLNYDNKTKTTFNTPGVDVVPKSFGNPETVEYLDTSKLSATIYFGAIVDSLVKKYGYIRGNLNFISSCFTLFKLNNLNSKNKIYKNSIYIKV